MRTSIFIKKVKIDIAGGFISGTIQGPIESESRHPAILVVHGLTSREDKYIIRFKELSQKGYICLTINLRGHGTSSGILQSLSREDHINDLRTSYNYLASLPMVDPKRIGIYGKSYGGYISAILSSTLNPKTIILGAPALYNNGDPKERLGSVLKRDPEAWKKFDLDKSLNFALSSLNKYNGKILVLVFEKDIEVPKPTTDTYIKIKPSITTYTIPDANHGLDNPTWDRQAMSIINEWFEKNL